MVNYFAVNDIGVEGTRALAEVLPQTSITSINLRGEFSSGGRHC